MQALSICIQQYSQGGSCLQLQNLSLTCRFLRKQLHVSDCLSSGSVSAKRPLRRGRPQQGVSNSLVQTPPQLDSSLEKPQLKLDVLLQQEVSAADWPASLHLFRQHTAELVTSAKPAVLQNLIKGGEHHLPQKVCLRHQSWLMLTDHVFTGLASDQRAVDALDIFETCKAAELTFSRNTYTWLISALIQVLLP